MRLTCCKCDKVLMIGKNRLYESVKKIRPEEWAVINAFIAEEQFQLAIQRKEIIIQNKHLHIILLQNLNSELEEKEIEAWHQLMRVLTHEIMNSVTPIVSLTSAIQTILNNTDGTRKDLSNLNEDNIEDVFSSLNTIASRSKGLLKFVNAYKEYSKPILLQMKPTDVVGMVNRIIDLFNPALQKFKISLHVNIQPNVIVATADVTLMEHVLINLMKNAMEAVAHDGTGEIAVAIKEKNSNRVSIAITDNGPGIDPETMARIFIPFFTTKPNGTGI